MLSSQSTMGWHTLRCPCADPRLTDYDTLLANIQDLQEGRATQVSQQLTAGQQLPGSCSIDELSACTCSQSRAWSSLGGSA